MGKGASLQLSQPPRELSWDPTPPATFAYISLTIRSCKEGWEMSLVLHIAPRSKRRRLRKEADECRYWAGSLL